MTVLLGLVGVVVAYLSGSVPWGVVLGKLLKGIDIREYGSGNTGATNSMRVLGWKIALSTGVLDLLKGMIPVLVARWLDAPALTVAAMAVAATVGHCWSPFMRFRGGKGMATGGGASIAMLPWLFTMIPLMAVVVLLTRYVSLGSIIVTLVGTTIAFIFAASTDMSWLWAVAVAVVSTIVLSKHKGNIERLLAGEERRFGMSESSSQ
jgi:glycerol-3-phosphate acyltransferase PlsY